MLNITTERITIEQCPLIMQRRIEINKMARQGSVEECELIAIEKCTIGDDTTYRAFFMVGASMIDMIVCKADKVQSTTISGFELEIIAESKKARKLMRDVLKRKKTPCPKA